MKQPKKTQAWAMTEFTGLMAPKLCLAGSNAKERWKTFKQQFNMYLLATGATTKSEAETISLVITLGGAELLTIFNSFDYNIEGKHVSTVKVVIERFDNYFAPRTNKLIDRYKFRLCKQLYYETSASYIARLCNLAKTCNFGNENVNNLRDQLVYGCHDDSLREKLFREETLTLQTARQTATAHEAARQNMNIFRGLKQTYDSATVNKVMKVKADKRVSPR